MRTFYVNQEILPRIFSVNLSKKAFEEKLQREWKNAKKISKKELLSYDMKYWCLRQYHYLSAEWEMKKVALEECGVWPKMSDLPIEMTYGSAVDTARAVREILEERTKITWENHRVLYIENMMRYAESITKYIPLLLLDGGTIRGMKASMLKDGKNFKTLPYDIDDGNNRAVALAILGETRVMALVGRTPRRNPLLESWV